MQKQWILKRYRGRKGQKGSGDRSGRISQHSSHNAPGAGKTMLARRIPSIMPELTEEEAMELTKIYSIAGLLSEEAPLILKRPFRNPHHTSPPQALTGGGRNPGTEKSPFLTEGFYFLMNFRNFQGQLWKPCASPLRTGRSCCQELPERIAFRRTLCLWQL